MVYAVHVPSHFVLEISRGIARMIHQCSTQYLLVNVQLVICFQMSLSHKHVQPARGCALQIIASKKLLDKRKEGLLTSHLNKLGGSLTCLLQASRLPEYTSLVVSTANGKVTGNIASIFCQSVTCLRTDQCCWDWNHKPG